MDDGLTSVADVKSAIELIHNSRTICEKRNLFLHKFASNNCEVLKSIPNLEKLKTWFISIYQ